MKRRVAITGMGAVTPIGGTVREMWAGVRSGRCGSDFITAFDTTDFRVKIAAEVKDADIEERLDKRAAKRMDRFSQLAVIAAKEAYEQSGLADSGLTATASAYWSPRASAGLRPSKGSTPRRLKRVLTGFPPFSYP